MSKDAQQLVKRLEARIAELTKANKQLHTQVEKADLLHEVSVSLADALDFETIVAIAVDFSKYLGATSGEVHLLADTGEVYFRSTYPERNDLKDVERQQLVRQVLEKGLDGWVLQTGQLALVLDTLNDERWLPIEYADQTVSVRSAICAPLKIGPSRLKGAISFVHPNPHHFDNQDLNLLGTLTAHVEKALENAYQVTDIKNSLREAHLMLDMSRHLSGTSNRRDIHNSLIHGVSSIDADHFTLLTCQGLSSNNIPTHAQINAVGEVTDSKSTSDLVGFRFALEDYTAIFNLVRNQETLVIEDIEKDERLAETERGLFRRLNIQSLVINPLITRIRVTGMLIIAHKTPHIFTERELALYRSLCNQTALATEHVKQIERTEQALTETQTLYRAGRVLAGAGGQQAILEEALFEFVYGLGLDQGGIVMIGPDRKKGQLMAYLEDGELKDVKVLQFTIDETIPYQEILLTGQPFVSSDFANDTHIVEFENFNQSNTIKSILQAPIIAKGETIGWIGADAVHQSREFSQREVDLARAMADQIGIALQNRTLLEQSQRRADLLRAVARVGEAVTGLTDLGEVLKLTVNLIRDRFGFYHVSIFLIDDAREWAVVKASTGEVGKIMVEQPHKLGVGSNSIVGFATQHAKPRIALDVGQDAVHFNNPLLPDTHSEMALPLISRGVTIGALDVQSVEPNAFTDEDVETLQIMADQLTTAIETARLFEETQRRLQEQAMLYSIGTKIGGTLDLHDTTNILVEETAQMLNAAECALSLLEEDGQAYTISDYVRGNTKFIGDRGERFMATEYASWAKLVATKQAVIFNIGDNIEGWEIGYLQEQNNTTMALVPILIRNSMIGILEVYDDRPGRRFNQDDITLLDSVALLAANAIENARLFEAAHESQTFMKSIIDQIPDPIFIKDPQHKWVVVNTAFTEGILGQPEDNVIGKSDYDFLPENEADWFWKQDDLLFSTAKTQETEEPITDHSGAERILYTRKVPLTLTDNQESPDYLIGIIQDITEQRQREHEREQLIEETRVTLKRTQTLYRVSNILAASTDQITTFEQVLGEYLQLLDLQQGSAMLFHEAANSNIAQARYINGEPVTAKLILPIEDDLVFKHLRQNGEPLVINNPTENKLTKSQIDTRGQQNVTSMLFIPLLIRGQLVGSLVADATTENHRFTAEDIEIGRIIADQLTIWLENRQLLEEAQHRSESLQTAADVSRAASSILNIEELFENSVNIIRDQFNFYYVGLFLLEGNWAVLKAGTGKAGETQLKRKHRLEIGGGSMIGWSVANRKARIALDVGQEAVHFRNPDLPDTRSEMALPLISRDEVLGALTVQSTERLAFSDEDITLLQTMADQLANAIKNADLFTQTQDALAEAEALYEVTQALSAIRDEETVYRLAIDFMAQARVDTAAVYVYLKQNPEDSAHKLIEQKAVWSATDSPGLADGTHFNIEELIIEPSTGGQSEIIIEDAPNNQSLSQPLRTELKRLGIVSLLVLPLSTHQKRLGLLLATYNTEHKTFSKNQVRYFNTIVQQMVVALENLQLLGDSQRRARREEIIREITGKIRGTADVNEILKTTVSEVSKLVGTTKGKIVLGVPSTTTGDTNPTNGRSVE